MREFIRILSATAAAVIVMSVLVAVSLGIRAVVQPASVAIDNRTFHESQAYNDGMARDLGQFQLDYAGTQDEGRRAAIRAVVRDRYAGYDDSRLPASLQAFLHQMKGY